MRGIYAILDEERDAAGLARAVLDAGVRIVQYRAKGGVSDRHAGELRRLTSEHDALFLINDDWRAALRLGADGVHVGPDDVPLAELPTLREAMGEALIGYSCGSEAEARAAESGGADYAGAGSVFATLSKSDAGEPIGIDGLRRIASATRLPIAAVGGITTQNLSEVRESGVAMAAVISAIADAPDPGSAAAQLVSIWNEA